MWLVLAGGNVTKEDQKLVSKTRFAWPEIFNKKLVSLHKIKEVLTLNKPAYIGISILNLSKTFIATYRKHMAIKLKIIVYRHWQFDEWNLNKWCIWRLSYVTQASLILVNVQKLKNVMPKEGRK